MKRKFFVLGAIALIAVVGLFVFEHVTSAQRPDRNAQPGQGQRGDRGGRNMMGMFNTTSFIDNSWLDLSFRVKIDDETLVKARPIHQASRDKIEKKMKALFESGDFQSMRTEMQTISTTAIKELQGGLKEILTKEQMTELTKLMKERTAAEAERRNRFRGGQGGQGGQRGQRPSQ